MVTVKVLGLLGLLLLVATSSWAQQPPGPVHPIPVDRLGENLFPPDLVMQHQQALGLSEEQRTFIKGEIQAAQVRFTELQWQLQSEMETIVALVKQERVDEQRTLAQLDKVVALEREIKRTHLALLIRVKNSLTADQQAKLQATRGR